jgi:hypothetical protein
MNTKYFFNGDILLIYNSRIWHDGFFLFEIFVLIIAKRYRKEKKIAENVQKKYDIV